MRYIGNTPGVSSQRVVLEEVISGSTKSAFTPVSGYNLGYVDVLVNGVEIDSSEFTASDGVTVTLGTAAQIGDTVKIKTWLPRGLSDGYLKSEADARYLKVDGSNYVTGNLGVGTSSVLGNSTVNAVQGFAARNSGATLAYFQTYNSNAGSDLKTWRWGGDNSGNLVFQTVNDAYSASTTRLALDSNGNAALATTPSAWGSAHKALQFSSIGAVSSDSGWSRLWQNAYSDGTNYRYLGNGAASVLLFGYQGLYAYTASSGTGGNTATMNNFLSIAPNSSLALQGASSVAGTGISFPATQSASSDANTLDDYEEGTWTPAFNLGTWTYTRQLGWYRKVGSQVTVWFVILWSATSNPSTMNVKNFPFTSISTTGYRATGAIGYQTGVTWTASYTTASWLMSENYASTDLGMQISGGASTFNLGHAASGEIQGTITYITT